MSFWLKSLSSRKIAAAVAILAILFFIFYFSGLKRAIKRSQIPQATPAPASEFKTVSEKTTDFPKEVTIEKGAVMISSYDIELESVFKSTRYFESQKSVSGNFDFYKNLLIKNKWQITNEFKDNEDVKSIFAAKNGTSLDIIFSKSDKVTVEINYSKPK